MTLREIVEIAYETAAGEGWELRAPLTISRARRRPLVGPVEWRIASSSEDMRSHNWVRIDDRDGEVISTGWRLGDPLPRAV